MTETNAGKIIAVRLADLYPRSEFGVSWTDGKSRLPLGQIYDEGYRPSNLFEAIRQLIAKGAHVDEKTGRILSQAVMPMTDSEYIQYIEGEVSKTKKRRKTVE